MPWVSNLNQKSFVDTDRAILGIGLFFLSFYVGQFVVGGSIVRNTEVDRVELLKRFWQVFRPQLSRTLFIVGYCYYK